MQQFEGLQNLPAYRPDVAVEQSTLGPHAAVLGQEGRRAGLATTDDVT